MQPAVIYLTHAAPSEVGNAGVHRSCQVLHELEKIVGRDRLRVLRADFLASLVNNGRAGGVNGSRRADRRFRQWVTFRSETAALFAKNPYRLFYRTAFANGLHPVIKDYYASRLKEIFSRAICVFDHTQSSFRKIRFSIG